MAPKKAVTIHTTDFPPYVISSLGDRHFLVAGGGGQARTGVPNVIEVFELKNDDATNSCEAISVCRHETSDAIMNGATVYNGKYHVLAAGVEEQCQLLHLKYKVVKPKPNSSPDGTSGVRKRKGNLTNSEENKTSPRVISFDISNEKSVQTDFAEDGGLQNVVRFSRDQSLIVTGGADGFLRVWKHIGLSRLYEIEAHKQEIEDLDISPSGNRIVTISKDKKASVWNTKDGSKFSDLDWSKKTAVKYRYRACRYGLIENKTDNYNLYTVNIPVAQGQKNTPSFITMWNSKDFQVKKLGNAGCEILSSFAVSDDGVYLATGSISGSISIFISFSLQRLYYVREAHSIFVTGLMFTPCTDSSRAITGTQDFTLISVSADNAIKRHQMPQQYKFSALWLLIGFIIIIYSIFWLLAELGL